MEEIALTGNGVSLFALKCTKVQLLELRSKFNQVGNFDFQDALEEAGILDCCIAYGPNLDEISLRCSDEEMDTESIVERSLDALDNEEVGYSIFERVLESSQKKLPDVTVDVAMLYMARIERGSWGVVNTKSLEDFLFVPLRIDVISDPLELAVDLELIPANIILGFTGSGDANEIDWSSAETTDIEYTYVAAYCDSDGDLQVMRLEDLPNDI